MKIKKLTQHMALLLGFSFFLAGCGGGSDAPESSPAPEGESVSTGTGAAEETRPSGSGSSETAAADAKTGSVKIGVLHSLSGTMAISETSPSRRGLNGDRGD